MTPYRMNGWNAIKNDKSRNRNENIVRHSIVLPILKELSWDIFDSNEVFPEYPVKTELIDYVLLMNETPQILLELKNITTDLNSINIQKYYEQAATLNISYVIITNGLQWQLHYRPSPKDTFIHISNLDVDFSTDATKMKESLETLKYFSRDVFSTPKLKLRLNQSLTKFLEELRLKNFHQDEELKEMIAERFNWTLEETEEKLQKVFGSQTRNNSLALRIPKPQTPIDDSTKELRINMTGKRLSSQRWRETRAKYMVIWESLHQDGRILATSMYNTMSTELGMSSKGNGPFAKVNISVNGPTLLHYDGAYMTINPAVKEHFETMVNLMGGGN